MILMPTVCNALLTSATPEQPLSSNVPQLCPVTIYADEGDIIVHALQKQRY